MKAKFITTEDTYLEAIIEIEGHDTVLALSLALR